MSTTKYEIVETADNGTHKLTSLVDLPDAGALLTVEKVVWPNSRSLSPLQEIPLSTLGLVKLRDAINEILERR